MPTTKAACVAFLKRRLPLRPGSDDEQRLIADLESWLPVGCRVLAERVLRSGHERKARLEKSYTVTIAAGAALLSAVGLVDLLVESLPGADITIAPNTNPWQWVPSLQDLRAQPTGGEHVYFTLSGGQIRTRNTDGKLTTLAGNATIANGVFVPKVAAVESQTTLPENFEAELFDIVLEMAAARLGVSPVPAEAAL